MSDNEIVFEMKEPSVAFATLGKINVRYNLIYFCIKLIFIE